MVESYLHKMAKELLYKEITDKGFFEFKTNDVVSLPLGNHGIYMEFPTHGGDYPDETICNYCPNKSCETCSCNIDTDLVYLSLCSYRQDYSLCKGLSWDCANDYMCIYKSNELNDRFSLKYNPGYCKCAQCEHLDKNGIKVHDLASIHKGQVVFAIEIINRHTPSWRKIESELNYQVYLIRAVDILKRVSNTPPYVYCIMGNRCWS